MSLTLDEFTSLSTFMKLLSKVLIFLLPANQLCNDKGEHFKYFAELAIPFIWKVYCLPSKLECALLFCHSVCCAACCRKSLRFLLH